VPEGASAKVVPKEGFGRLPSGRSLRDSAFAAVLRTESLRQMTQGNDLQSLSVGAILEYLALDIPLARFVPRFQIPTDFPFESRLHIVDLEAFQTPPN
jgi:hypothetical protein